jgi:hypothetical protein
VAARSTVLNHHHDSERCPEQGNELLNGEILYNLNEAQIVIEQWR